MKINQTLKKITYFSSDDEVFTWLFRWYDINNKKHIKYIKNYVRERRRKINGKHERWIIEAKYKKKFKKSKEQKRL